MDRATEMGLPLVTDHDHDQQAKEDSMKDVSRKRSEHPEDVAKDLVTPADHHQASHVHCEQEQLIMRGDGWLKLELDVILSMSWEAQLSNNVSNINSTS